MASSEPRQRLPVPERRALIVEGAGRLFGEHGYDNTRLDDVAAAAGVTKPILYRHFDSKRALYLALLERHRDDLSSFVGAIPAEGALSERLRAVLDGWLDYVEAHSYAWKMLFRDTGGGPEVAALRRRVHARARTVLAEIVAELATDPIPRRELAPVAELLSMGMASLVLWWIEDAEVSRAAVLAALTTVWVRVLGVGVD
jgi:AcrR family transcriptional regulator